MNDVDRLTRWELFGGTWEVLSQADAEVTISLRRCDGGEEQERFTSADPVLLTWLAERDR